MGKKTIVSVKKKNSLPYLKCVLRLSCVVHGPIYGRFMGFYVNGFLSTSKKVYLYTTNQIFSTYHLSSFPMVSLSVWFSYRNSPISSCSCLQSSSNLACSASKFAFSSFTAFNTNMTSGTVWWLQSLQRWSKSGGLEVFRPTSSQSSKSYKTKQFNKKLRFYH